VARPALQVISPDATPDQVAAIVAVLSACTTTAGPAGPGDDTLHEWVRTARLRAHRTGLRRGPWRLSGRMPPRRRA
jgi:hypothetical protein